VLQSAITLVAMAGILLPFGAWVPLTLVLSTLPAFAFTVYYQRQRHQWQMRVTRRQRRVRYYEYFLTRRENIPEIRIFNLSPYFRRLYRGLRQRLRQEQVAIIRQQALADLGAGGLAIAASGGVMVVMIWRALQGQVSLGDLTLLYQAFNQGQGLMKTLLSRAGQLYFNSLFIENLKTFLDLTPVLVEAAQAQPLPAGVGLRFEQVGFRYPHSDRWALRDFNLTIEPGQFVAIVGTNGAGKSTLMKLLCRFYDPTEGRIWVGDRELTTIQQEALRRAITVLFQHPVQYAETVRDNIAYGAWETDPSPAAIAEAAAIAGADQVIRRLPQGYDEVLGKFLGNSELSTGEWQKVALARAFLRQAEIVLLDEPTSAMDSWAELEWMGRFRQLVAGRIAIMITHRFTTAMQADRIYVMDQGTLVEAGTHQQLLALGGRYAQSWQQQMAGQAPDSPPTSLLPIPLTP
jgi:ATP-binding cassette subfamily B protein